MSLAKALLPGGPLPDSAILEATVARIAESQPGWYQTERFLAEYAPVAPNGALQLYETAFKTQNPEPYWSSYQYSESILRPGLTTEDPEVVKLAREVTQLAAEQTEDDSLLELLDESE